MLQTCYQPWAGDDNRNEKQAFTNLLPDATALDKGLSLLDVLFMLLLHQEFIGRFGSLVDLVKGNHAQPLGRSLEDQRVGLCPILSAYQSDGPFENSKID
jgi:hypothetical protein